MRLAWHTLNPPLLLYIVFFYYFFLFICLSLSTVLIFSFKILFSSKSFWYSVFVSIRSLTYSCIALSYFLQRQLEVLEVFFKFHKNVFNELFFGFLLFLLSLFMLKIQIKSLRLETFFLCFQILSFYFHHLLVKFSTSPVFFVLILYEKCLHPYYRPAPGSLHLISARIFLFVPIFNFVQINYANRLI